MPAVLNFIKHGVILKRAVGSFLEYDQFRQFWNSGRSAPVLEAGERSVCMPFKDDPLKNGRYLWGQNPSTPPETHTHTPCRDAEPDTIEQMR